MKLGIDLCRSLEYCGQLHIIHRISNLRIFLYPGSGDFKLGDFGIARELEKTMSTLSKKGTYSYMAPEMYRENSTTAEWTFMHLAWCYIN